MNRSLIETTQKIVELYPIETFKNFLDYLLDLNKSTSSREKVIGEEELTKTQKDLSLPTRELVLIFGSNSNEKWIINDESIIGRFDPEVGPIDIDLSYIKGADTVSRRHARFFYRENNWFLEELNSINGTYLNGERISKPTVLKSGDIVDFGKVRCQIEVQEKSE